jgi:hypothetical protein
VTAVAMLALAIGLNVAVRDPEHILVGSMRWPSDNCSRPERRRGYFDRVEARLKTIPGIDHESLSSTIPVKFVALRRAGNSRTGHST